MKFAMCLLIVCFFTINSVVSKTHKGKMYLNNGDVIKSKAILVQDSVVKYRLTNEPNTLFVNKKDIREIEIVDGNYALYGLGAGLVFSLPIANEARSHDDAYLTLAAGGCVGLLLGTLINDYQTIRFNEDDNLSFLDGVKLIPEIYQPNITLINYSLSF